MNSVLAGYPGRRHTREQNVPGLATLWPCILPDFDVRDIGFFEVSGGVAPGKDRSNDALLDVCHEQGRVSMTTKVRTIPEDADEYKVAGRQDIL